MAKRTNPVIVLAVAAGLVMLPVQVSLLWFLAKPDPEPVTAQETADYMWDTWSSSTRQRICTQLAVPSTRAVHLEVIRESVENDPHLRHLSATDVADEIEKNC